MYNIRSFLLFIMYLGNGNLSMFVWKAEPSKPNNAHTIITQNTHIQASVAVQTLILLQLGVVGLHQSFPTQKISLGWTHTQLVRMSFFTVLMDTNCRIGTRLSHAFPPSNGLTMMVAQVCLLPVVVFFYFQLRQLTSSMGILLNSNDRKLKPLQMENEWYESVRILRLLVLRVISVQTIWFHLIAQHHLSFENWKFLRSEFNFARDFRLSGYPDTEPLKLINLFLSAQKQELIVESHSLWNMLSDG